MIRMQIYDKYTKQYHKYVTRKLGNFASGNNKYNQQNVLLWISIKY